MRSGITFTLPASDRVELDALVADRNTAQKHVWRAHIALLSAAGLGIHAIMREAGVSKTAVCAADMASGCFAAEAPRGIRRSKEVRRTTA